jgi:predicted thioesterase
MLEHRSHDFNKARFTLGVRANVQHKSSIPIGAKVEINPKVGP